MKKLKQVCYLMNLLPAVLVHAAHLSMIMQQELAAVRVAPHHRAVIQRSQATTVLVIRRSAQIQQRLHTKVMVTSLNYASQLACLFSLPANLMLRNVTTQNCLAEGASKIAVTHSQILFFFFFAFYRASGSH